MILDWRRPHPLSIAVQAVTFATSNALPLIVIFAAGGGVGFDRAPLAVGGVTAGVGVAQWYMTSYAITEASVDLKSGVLSRQARSIPFDRVQQVSVGQPVIARVFQMATVEVSEASADGEITISYLSLGAANELAGQLRSLTAQVGVAEPHESTDAAPPPPPQEYTIHVGDNLETGRFHALMVLPVLAVVALVGLFGAVALVLSGERYLALLVGAAALAVMLFGGVVNVAGSVLTLGNFELARRGPVLVASMGLLSRRNLEVRSHRIQTLSVVSGPLARNAGLHQVAFSAAVGKTSPQQRIAHLAPTARSDDVDSLIGRSVGGDSGWSTVLESVSPATTRRFLVRSALWFVVLGLPLCVGAFLMAPLLPVVVVLAWAGLSVPYARERFRRLGFAMVDDRFVSRSGVVNHRLTQLEPTNVQTVLVIANWFQRRLGVADLVVSTAGIGPSNMVRVPDMPAARAREMADSLGGRAADTVWELRD